MCKVETKLQRDAAAHAAGESLPKQPAEEKTPAKSPSSKRQKKQSTAFKPLLPARAQAVAAALCTAAGALPY